jgi:septal ring factor EnvC (AmiA/AmiB activator)
MAPSAVPFEPSYAALTNLRHKIHKHTTSVNLTLPTRPLDLSTDSNPYLDGAIGILSDSTALLYDDDAPWAVKVIEVKKAVDRVDTKVDEVKTEVAEIKTEVAEIKTEIGLLGERQDRLENQIDDVRTAVNNGRAIQLNSLRKWLDDPIQPVSALVQIGDRQRYMVAEDFPTTVRDFWRLLSNKSALTRLANHYSVASWDRWKRAT